MITKLYSFAVCSTSGHPVGICLTCDINMYNKVEYEQFIDDCLIMLYDMIYLLLFWSIFIKTHSVDLYIY